MTRWLLGGAALVVALLAALWLPRTQVAASAAGNAEAAIPMPAAGPATSSSLLERWRHSSQRGSEVDGTLSFDANGQLRVDADLRRLLDYALTLQGEFSIDEIRALLLHWVTERHGDSRAALVAEQFERYLALKQAEAGLAGIVDLDQRLAALIALREQHFGADADAMFGDDEAYAAHTLQRLAIQRDASLSDQERASALHELDSTRSRQAREADRTSMSAVTAAEQERQAAAGLLSAEQLHRERTALWGQEAAGRLATLDAERAAWDTRIASYSAARDRLAADASLSPAARQDAIASLLQQRFNANERRRIASLEAVGALGK